MKVPTMFLCLCVPIFGALDTGYPLGYMADCPGMNKSTIISEKTKRSLYVIVIRPNNHRIFGYAETKCKLNFNGAACVAKHLDLRRRKTQVLISGYMDTSFLPLIRSMADVYLSRGRNVIILELFPMLVRPYPIAARACKPIGNIFGEFFAALTHYGLSSKKLEIVGGSLGAHIAAYASEKFYQLTGKKPSRLTGLDPAGPCFRNLPIKERFNANAANKVDVLHTNMDGFGIAEAAGHVDFYANGVTSAPSNTWLLAYDYPNKFIGVRCASTSRARHGDCYDGNITGNVLGPRTNFNEPGIYYLPTAEKPPYYMGVEGLKKIKYGANSYLLKPAPDEDLTI